MPLLIHLARSMEISLSCRACASDSSEEQRNCWMANAKRLHVLMQAARSYSGGGSAVADNKDLSDTTSRPQPHAQQQQQPLPQQQQQQQRAACRAYTGMPGLSGMSRNQQILSAPQPPRFPPGSPATSSGLQAQASGIWPPGPRGPLLAMSPAAQNLCPTDPRGSSGSIPTDPRRRPAPSLQAAHSGTRFGTASQHSGQPSTGAMSGHQSDPPEPGEVIDPASSVAAGPHSQASDRRQLSSADSQRHQSREHGGLERQHTGGHQQRHGSHGSHHSTLPPQPDRSEFEHARSHHRYDRDGGTSRPDASSRSRERSRSRDRSRF